METLFSAEQLAYLDSLYVRKNDCNDRHERAEQEVREIMIKQEVITTKLAFIEKISWVIATATIGSLVAQIGSVIFK